PIQAGYQIALESYPLLADSLTAGQLWLDFDLRLENYHPTGTEQMLVQVWNWESQVWSTVSTYSNIDGSFDWVSEHLEITDQVMGSVFKIRFAAKGENSLNILGWYVDNIHAYRACNPPLNLDANLIQNPLFTMILNWEAPEGTSNDQWIEWDDGVNYSAVGVGAAMPFDVAARWKPEQLSDFAGDSITQIAFIPTASSSTYRARVWIGEMAENLIVDQEEISPVIGEWNIISLLAPVPLDIYQDLWVGYQNDGPNGYQMGVDDGPAIDGYGNMLKFGPTWWTLLEINPELDYNWNIQAFLKHNIEDDTLVTYAIYRSDNGMPYYLRDYTENTYYDDDSAMCEPLGSSHFYKISALYAGEADTCESVFSNEAGDICEGTDEMTELSILNLYPNPATDMLFIETAEEIINVSLFDSRGGQVVGWYGGKVVGWYGGKVVGWYGGMVKVEVPVSGLAPGLYLVRIRTDEAVVSRKIIVQK
ncbi:MAG: T9SS type A sorting domain-containing protein, partial [Bacteroidales bacterium]|nr:T9SS type A sorting domain-containing protein [Bacteroidales bacterium]